MLGELFAESITIVDGTAHDDAETEARDSIRAGEELVDTACCSRRAGAQSRDYCRRSCCGTGRCRSSR